MPIILVGLAKLAYVVIPLTALIAAYNGWYAWRAKDRRSLLRALWWIAGPWIAVVLLTGFDGIEELMEDGFDGNPVILSPLIGLALLVAVFVGRDRPPSDPHSSINDR